ncbi:MAG: DUF445 domain-containing protein [Selenomonadaceae bacterium]|nr:DUF445 domain-containing protein [Selenomonadaceae bacterium]
MNTAKRNYKSHERYANFSLLIAAILFVVTLYMSAKNPDSLFWEWFHFAADAALVGGIADWFAVTAIFEHPFGISVPNTAILPKQKETFADGSANLIKKLITDKKILREVKAAMPNFLQKAIEAFKSPENQTQAISKLMELVREEMLEDGRGKSINDLADLLRKKLLQYDSGKLLRYGLNWLQTGDNGYKALEMVAPYFRSYVQSEDFFRMLEGRFKQSVEEKANEGFFSRAAVFIGEKLDIVNVDDGARETQRQLINIADELAIRNSELQNKVLYLIRKCSDDMLSNRYVRDIVDGLRHKFIHDLPLEDVLNDLFSHLSQSFQSETTRKNISDYAAKALHSHVAEVLKEQFALIVELLRNDSELQNSFKNFLHEVAGRTAVVAKDEAAQLVQSVLKGMTDEEMNAVVKSQISKDLMFIRLNGAFVGAIIGTVLFFGIIGAQKISAVIF